MPESGGWEKRWNPLRDEWVVYAAHRNARPWNGAKPQEQPSTKAIDPECYLCPGRPRIGGNLNPDYRGVFVFDNDHPVLGITSPPVSSESFPFPGYDRSRAFGLARVICYHADHRQSMADMHVDEVFAVFREFQKQTTEIKARQDLKSVFIFENRGSAVGVSNLHPHAQLYAADFNWNNIEAQLTRSARYRNTSGVSLFDAIVSNECHDGRRMIAENEHAVAFIPYFARYAYETMIFPRAQHQDLTTLDESELRSLSTVFRNVVRKMNRMYDMEFPYVLSVMQAPVDGYAWPDYRMHLWLQPPYRQPGLVKYLAGPELGAGNFMADTMPEVKAAELRAAESD